MVLQRSLHFVVASLLVMGMFAITDSHASAVTPPAATHKAVASHSTASVRATTPSPRREVFGFGLASSLGDPTFGYPSWNFSLGTPNMCAALINRSVTVSQAVAQVAAKGVDGLNVDYEGLNGTCQNGQTAQAMMTDFARQLRGALPSGAYLSVDTYASSAADSLGFFDIPGLNAYVDSFFVMAYDLEYSNYHYPPLNCVSFCLGPTAPLAGYHYNDTTTASQYAAVVTASKVILGVPYYGGGAPELWSALSSHFVACAAASLTTSPPSQAIVGTRVTVTATASGCPDPSPLYQFWILTPGATSWQMVQAYSTTTTLSWNTSGAPAATYQVAVWVRDSKSQGVFANSFGRWDASTLIPYALISSPCSAVDLSGSPAASGGAVTLTAHASSCPNPLFQFWILAPGATSYQVVQAYSSTPTWTWNTSGVGAGTYVVAVWARDTSSTGISGNSFGRWDASNSIQYSLPCSAVTLTSSPSGGAPVGTVATITAQASSCANPLYEVWLLTPGATSWQMVQAYSTSATLRWTTTGAPLGTYSVAVWARDSNSTGTSGNSFGRWDAFGSSQYILSSSACAAVTVSSAPLGSATVGARVTITAQASGCASPQYQFWILTPGASAWQMVQAYSTNATLQWNTSGAPKGTYQVAVWARDSSSTGTSGNSFGRWDAYGATNYA